ncbi:MAG TPA: CAP domain-containing protein [Puia sp.]|jgi:uncharacterized protein YkwD
MRRDLPKLSFFFLVFIPARFAWTTGIPRPDIPVQQEKLPVKESRLLFSMVTDILTYVNEDRKQQGLAPLTLNEVESDIAARHSQDMASGRVPFGHSGINTRAKAIRKALGAIRSVGENVASGPMNAREVVDGWLHSPGHKRNIEGDFTLTGIGYAPDKKGNIFFTQIFSK